MKNRINVPVGIIGPADIDLLPEIKYFFENNVSICSKEVFFILLYELNKRLGGRAHNFFTVIKTKIIDESGELETVQYHIHLKDKRGK
ncbi:hypothetical protein B6U98_05835 [Thermoplasmatales archaeon ex4572_165]|nr:MAG: hypothetical protein B6U98_05835 [Thermoplasmatales archaeon ex4572_165]RLF59219.1 MAG: hypothetical protein DRN27_03270 [Thermoplasmata archaeon]